MYILKTIKKNILNVLVPLGLLRYASASVSESLIGCFFSDDVTAPLLLPPRHAQPTTTSPDSAEDDGEQKNLGLNFFLLHHDFIGSYYEGPSAVWSAALEQLL